MRNILIYTVLFSFLSIQAHPQTTVVDSLRKAYVQATDQHEKINSYYELAYLIVEADPEEGMNYADTLEQLAKLTKNKKDFSRVEYIRGLSYELQGKFEEALAHHQKELYFALQTDDLELQGKALGSVGYSFHDQARNDSAIVYLIRAAEIKEQLGNHKDLAGAYANIGNIFSDQKMPDKAVEYLEKALAIRLSIPNGEKSAIITYNNISIAYEGTGNYDKAIEYAQKGYELANKSGNQFFAGVLSGSLGHLWMKKKDMDKALEMTEQSIRLLKEANRISNLVYPYATLSEVWSLKGNYAKALEVNLVGYQIMEELKLHEPLEEYYKNFANAYESLDQPKESLFWLKKYMDYKDSLYIKENVAAVAEAETKYETKNKEAQLARQQLEIERQANQKKNIIIAAIAAVLGLILLFQYLRFKIKTGQKEAELSAQLRLRETEKLKELDNIKSTFFANISHEFRTPLTLILSPVEQMINGTFKGDVQKYYRIIHQNGKRLLDLVNQLLDLSKLESGKLKLEVSKGDLGHFIKAVAGSFESLAEHRQIHFEVNTPERVTSCYFDGDKVEKILVNLISNAFKFTHQGDEVVVDLKIINQWATITVRDTGLGIPTSQLPQLFERFSTSNPSEVQAGSGIGLALTKELTELHGGSIAVQSEDHKGSVFTVKLPVGNEFFNPEQFVESKNSNLFSPHTFKVSGLETVKSSFTGLVSGLDKPLLLLVEDNADLRAYIAETMSHEFQVIEAENGKQAIDKAIQTTPDLVITDLMMPEMDGITFCKLLKTNEKTSHVPVIMLTARAEQTDKFEGLSTGADDYLVKPFDARELQVRGANLIKQRKKLQDHYRDALHTFSPVEVKVDSMDTVFLQKIKETIEASLEDENFNVVQLGHEIGMSRSQLHRKLSALTGFSPNEVIRNMRLERAKQLLEQKAATVSEVAYLCGFSSPAYFIKCFKDYFGSTPGQTN